jgi:hypothetical protein
MKTYKNEEWDFKWSEDDADSVDTRIYIDLEGNPITGILEDFKIHGEKYLKAHPYDTNSVIVRDGRYKALC